MKTAVLAALAFAPFHEVLAGRIAKLDINDPSCVSLAERIADDATTTKVPVDKIEDLYKMLQEKKTDIAGSDSQFVNQVNQSLMRADDGFQQQIEFYRANGYMSDVTTTTRGADDDLGDKTVDAAVADQALGNKLNGSEQLHHQV